MDHKTDFKRAFRQTSNIVFDFDGIIVDSEYFFFQAAKKALNGFFCIEEKYYYKYWTNIGNGLEKLAESVKLSKSQILEIKRKIKKNYISFVDSGQIKAYDEIYHILGILSSSKDLYIASNTPENILIKLLKKNSINSSLFKGICGKDRYTKPKPNPDIFLKLISKFNLDPETTMVIEDTEKGIIASKNAGLRSIAIISKHNSEADLSTCDAMFHGHKEFLTFIRESLS